METRDSENKEFREPGIKEARDLENKDSGNQVLWKPGI